MQIEDCTDDEGDYLYIGGSQKWSVADESNDTLQSPYEFGMRSVLDFTPWEHLQVVASIADATDAIERYLSGDPSALMLNEADGPLLNPGFSVLWMPLEHRECLAG